MVNKSKEVDKMAVKIEVGTSDSKWIIITAIAAIASLEAIALLMGINGILLTTVIGVIALCAGVVIPTPKILGGK